MEWYRQELPLIRELIDDNTLCSCCGRPLIEEGHQSVFELRIEQPDTPLKTLAPGFRLFAVYLLQCECGAWMHGDCLKPGQEQRLKTAEVIINGVRTKGQANVATLTCPSCQVPLWEISSKRPNPWGSELPVRLPARTRYTDLVRSYELYLAPHLTAWPSVLLRPRGQANRQWELCPYPKDGLLPSLSLIAQNRGWLAQEATLIHRIAHEVCTNEATIKTALADHIAHRERQRVEKEHLEMVWTAKQDNRL